MKFPTVIWMGREPIHKGNARRFRLVHRGPARPNRPDDVPFACEERIGQSMMKRLNWGPPRSGFGEKEAIYALSHALGQLLMVDMGKLRLDHPLYCELNMAVAEERDPRGCDCNGPDEPEEHQETT